MTVDILPGQARGTVAAPPSKSMAHRLLICAGLARGISHIRGVAFNEDVCATVDCLRALGAECTVSEDTVTVRGADLLSARPRQVLCCRESGSTLRFLLPAALLCGETLTFTGAPQLFARPLDVYARLCADRGLTFEKTDAGVRVKGRLEAGTFCVPGDISSQFVTGLLLALPLAEGRSVIRIQPPVESRGYIHMTLQALHAFGIRARWQDPYTLTVDGGQQYQAADMAVEGDYSAAAVFAALNALGGDIQITGLSPDSLQGDRMVQQHLESLCAGRPEIDISDCPDLGPILFAVAAAKNGAVFTGTRRLKFKESDRAEAMARELAAFGAKVTVAENTVTVAGGKLHRPRRPLDGHNDHRVVMALAVLLTLTGGRIEGARAVGKSFPDFFQKLRSLGIEIWAEENDK